MKRYIITEAQINEVLGHTSNQVNRILHGRVLSVLGALPEVGEPVTHEFQGRDGEWYPFIGQDHYDNTVLDGTYPIRALYTLENLNETNTKTSIPKTSNLESCV